MRTNPQYITYYQHWARLLVLGGLPFALMVYYNYNVYKALKLPSNVGQFYCAGARRCNQEGDLARVMIGIVTTFIFCHSVRVILNCYDMIAAPSPQILPYCSSPGKATFATWAHIALPFNRLILIVNSSVNPIIYCCLNAAFKQQVSSCNKHFCKRLCRCCTVQDNVQCCINIDMHQQPITESTYARNIVVS